MLRIVSNLFVLVFALVFVCWGIQFVRFGWDQKSELAELPMRFIFLAWPLAGVTWLLFLGEVFVDNVRILAAGTRHDPAALTPGMAALILFGVFFVLIARVPVAFALGLACLPARLRAAAVADGAVQRDLQGLQLVHPAGGAVLPADGQPDEHRRHHRPAGQLSRAMVGNLPGALAQINVVLSVFFAGISGSSTADAASQSKIFIDAQTKEGYDLSFSIAITAVSAVLAVIIPPSILMIVWGGVISVSIGALYLAGIIPGLLIAAPRWRPCTSTPSSTNIRSTRARRSGVHSRRSHLDPGAHDAVHHRRRHPAGLVHADGIGRRRGDLCGASCPSSSTARWT